MKPETYKCGHLELRALTAAVFTLGQKAGISYFTQEEPPGDDQAEDFEALVGTLYMLDTRHSIPAIRRLVHDSQDAFLDAIYQYADELDANLLFNDAAPAVAQVIQDGLDGLIEPDPAASEEEKKTAPKAPRQKTTSSTTTPPFAKETPPMP